ncbi:MAG: hypothetical protein GKR91_07485 [Pseudomonadales bacterium]|nr:hypothetical protein [Pseudomonadales bacterium]
MSSDQLSFFDRNDRERGLFEPNPTANKPSSFSLTKTINAPSQQVFDQWLIPVFIGDWMFGPNVQREQVISLENKVRKGGDYKFLVNRKGQEIEVCGEIQELDIPKKLVLSWVENTHPNEISQITAQFESHNEKTKLKLGVKLPAELSPQKDAIKKLWSTRLSALAKKLK